ncbi:MAG: cell filamentation protein Fic [Betaproteobacteria bacterium RIFCSPLOWO2_12_FULL_62_13]|nr:MAG: cell filamentation protein Fic [Betaproteobacteria bacterium RIFCSPLOWO2_12_FULL_62_13]
MSWNWQQPDWPNFSWNKALLVKADALFLVEAGEYVGTVKHLVPEDRDQLTVAAMGAEAVTTSEIEGVILDRASVQSSIRRQLGLAAAHRKIGAAEQGMSEMMVDLYRSYAQPLSDDTLFRWHRMLTSGRSDLKDIGRYRTHVEPMQIVSGAIHKPKVHFQAPASSDVPVEMSRFIEWFRRTAPGGSEPLPALTRAGIAHLFFVCIHPFEDGNGRIGRAIAEKALAQSLGHPTLTALAATILAKRKTYYAALEANNKHNEITPWLSWFAATAIEAQRRAIALVDFMIDKVRLLDRLRDQLNDRQKKALLRMLREGPEDFEGGLSAGKYASITGASPATATRDLADLVAKHALVRTGEHRHARYHIAIPLRPVSTVALDEHGNLK